MTPAQKRRFAERQRAALLRRLRAESILATKHRVDVNSMNTPALAGLVVAARQSSGRSVRYRGIKFPTRIGWARHIDCPETGQPLVSVSGGLLI